MIRAIAVLGLVATAAVVAACPDRAEKLDKPGQSITASPNHPPLPGETNEEPRADVKADVEMRGSDHVFVLVASAPPPFVIKNTTPFSVALRSDPEVKFAKATLSRGDFVDAEAPDKTVTTKVTAPPGEHTIEADAVLYVCSAELCKQVQQHLTARFTAVPKT